MTILKPFLEKLFRLRERANQAASTAGEGAPHDPHEKPFLDHLEDLRMMFMRMIITQMIVTFAAFAFHEQLFDFAFIPLRSELSMVEREVDADAELGPGQKLKEVKEADAESEGKTKVILETLESKVDMSTFSPAEAFMLSLKVAFIAGFILAFPFHAYFLAQFVLPGLTEREKRLLLPGIAIGFVLFLCGASFSFFGALPYALKYLFAYALSLDIASGWRVGYYIGFVTQATLAFGLCFQMPLVVTLLVKLRLLTYRSMKNSRSLAIVIMSVLSAVLTPPDPVTMIFMAVPMIILYEICIWIAYFMNRKQDAIDAAEEAEYQAWLQKHKEEEARLAETRQLAAQSQALANDAVDHDALSDEWDDHTDHAADPYHDWHANRDALDDSWIDHYSEDLSEVECPEDRANIARRRKAKAIVEAAKAQAEKLVNINYASLEELQTLPGIGQSTAEKIIAARPFGSTDELLEIDGFSRAKFDRIDSKIFAG